MEIDLEEMGCMWEDSAGSESSLISSKLYPNNKADPSESVPPAKERLFLDVLTNAAECNLIIDVFLVKTLSRSLLLSAFLWKRKKRKSALKQ